MKSLLHTKKMFIDTYGKVPPMIGFLGIDTDGGEFTKSLQSVKGETITLAENEKLQLDAQGAVDFYNNYRAEFSWVPEPNINAIAMLRGDGAGGVRSNGRFALTVNKSRVKNEILNKINSITSADIIGNESYALLNNNIPEIHMVFSICGGTGCGTFLNVAYILKEINPAFRTTGYAVLPGAFKTLAAAAHVIPNTYGALVDLDYLMSRGIQDTTPVELKCLTEVYSVKDRPFTNVMFIDNVNSLNDNYGNVEALSKMISLALVTSASELSVAGASVGDNFSVIISMGTLDIINKKAWAGGMGACEIVYRTEVLSDIYKYKAGINIIDRMFNSCDDANAIANVWIDSSEVHIRENNGQDHVTDYICAKEPRYPLTINNYRDPLTEVNANLTANKYTDEEITKKVDNLVERVRTELRNLIVKHINKECGVSLAKNILEEIKIQVGLCLGEMKKEKDELTKEKPTLKAGLEATLEDVKRIGTFTLPGTREKRLTEAKDAVEQYNMCLLDIQRHDAAITVYNSILLLLDECDSKLKEIEGTLRGVKQNLQAEVAKLQNGIASENSIFQINLAEEDAKTVVVKSEDVLMSEFIDTLEGNLKVYGFTEYSVKEVENFVLNFTKTLNGCKGYADRSVEQLLRDINERNPEELKQIIQKASRKSLPLFKYNMRGRMPKQNMIDMIYVGVEDQANSILKANDLFKNNLPPASNTVTRNVDFASTGMKDKVIIYHQVGVVPVYAVYDILDYRETYKHTYALPEAFHFDADMKRSMDRIPWDIMPDDPSPVPDSVKLWVQGFIYGLIKNDKGTYQIKSKSLGEPLDDYWVRLNLSWRDEAFAEFSRKQDIIRRDFNEHFANELATKGQLAITELINNAKNNYWEVSQIKIDRATLDSKPYAKVKELFQEELRKLEEM